MTPVVTQRNRMPRIVLSSDNRCLRPPRKRSKSSLIRAASIHQSPLSGVVITVVSDGEKDFLQRRVTFGFVECLQNFGHRSEPLTPTTMEYQQVRAQAFHEGHEILDVPEDESGELLNMLCRHAIKPEFVFRQRWRVGDLLMWDNVATQHIAEFNYALPQRRYLHRTTLEGVALA